MTEMVRPLEVNPDIRHRREDFGGVLFDLERKDFYPLNPAGYSLFQDLLAAVPRYALPGQLVEQAARSDVFLSVEQATKAVGVFLSELVKADVLRPFQAAAESRPFMVEPETVILPVPRLKSPLVVSLSVIFTCNLLCEHCYVGSTNEIKKNSMTPEEARGIVRRLGELEVFDIVITGGEATLFSGLTDIIKDAKLAGIYTALNTNGTTLNRRRVAELRDSGLDCVKISIDSPDPATHDAFRGREGAFAKTCVGIRQLVHAGLRVDLHTTLSQSTTRGPEDIDQLLNLSRDLGVRRLHFGRVFATGRATDGLKMDREGLLQTLRYVRRLKEAGDTLIGRVPPVSQPDVPAVADYDGCGGCGRGVYAYVSYDGGVYPCTNLYKDQWRFGDLRQGDFADFWANSPVYRDLRSRLADSMPAISNSIGHG